MEISGVGKSPNASLSFRYNANNEELEELYQACDDDPPTPQCEPPPLMSHSENASPKKGEKSSSLIDKYFKSMRAEKPTEKLTEKADEGKPVETKSVEEPKPAKEVTSSPMKEYLNRLGKRSTAEVSPDVKEGPNETWKIFHDFKFKIAQAVEDMKTRSSEETKEKTVLRDNSMSDSEENSAVKDIDQQSVGDTDNQVSSLESSMQNLSEMTQPLTAKATERESSLPTDNKNNSDSSDDTHKNLAFDTEVTKEFMEDSNTMEVESGIEALEDSMDGFGDVQNVNQYQNNNPIEFEPERHQPTPTNVGLPPSRTNFKSPPPPEPSKKYFFNFSMYFLTFLIFLNLILFPNSNIWNGFIFGLWFFCFASNLQCWVLDNYFTESSIDRPSLGNLQFNRSSVKYVYTIPAVKEHRPLKKYENWINHYRFPDYDPDTYHINKTTTAFMKLEGCNLRISYTRTKISKRALWDEKIENIVFYQHRLYNLTGARVILLPKGLVKRRQWSKKYPICVILSDKEKVQVFEKENVPNEKRVSESQSEKKKEQLQHEMETETNASPEKKRKFVWRRKEKSVVHSEGEVGKEGLRHRLVRKMHRDKKTDVSTGTDPVDSPSPSPLPDKSPADEIFHDADELASKSVTSTKEENEEEFDENELSKIKEFLEEAEMEGGVEGTVEGEWSVHVKQTSSNLYLFTRTGRDKHEWYRRLVTAVTEANAASNETSAADDKTSSEMSESRDILDVPPYKPADKDTVTFSKTSAKTVEHVSVPEGGTVFLSQLSHTATEDSYENFWPYLTKIIQQNKSSTGGAECECQRLPAEVTWVNAVLARIMYDVMRDPVIQQRLQNRIQRKLNTIKLPSFMSPLVVTELSLSGACPQVSRAVCARADPRGVWLDALLRYDGGAHIVLLTQINLMKLKEKHITLEDQIMTAHDNVQVNVVRIPSSSEAPWGRRRSAAYDSDIEDSAESSSDDESPPIQPVDSKDTLTSEPGYSTQSLTQNSEGGSSKRKFLRMVDKIATNKYFQQVTDYKYVKRAMEGLSNTDIKLQLELHSLEGQLAINLPAPPHDRIWIGFRHNPQLILKARPAVGARTLRFAHISNWIEQKLMKEFEKVLVLPNMEDIIVDVMTPTPVAFE